MTGVVCVVLWCSIPAYAGSPKAKAKVVDKSDPPADLILTLPDQWQEAGKVSPSINRNMLTHNNDNETQASALKRRPVNVDCDMDVIQNTLGDVPLGNRVFGQCDLHYHY